MTLSITPADLSLPGKFTSFRSIDSKSTQLDIANEIFATDKRFILLSSPTGSGKSLIYITLHQLLSTANPNYRSLVAVLTKRLQDQLDEFESIGLTTIKGADNYRCLEHPRGGSCAVGKCTVGHTCDLRNTTCHYYSTLRSAFAAPIPATNYAYLLSRSRYTQDTDAEGPLGKIDLLICDEAHLLPNWLRTFANITIVNSQVWRDLEIDIPKSIPRDVSPIEFWQTWSVNIRPRLESAARTAVLSGETGWRVSKLKSTLQDIRDLSTIDDESNWVYERSVLRNPPRIAHKLTPVDISAFIHRYIYQDVSKVLLVSANLTKAKTKALAVPNDQYLFVQSGKGFDPKRRPVYWYPVVKVGRSMTPAERRLWLMTIDQWIGARLRWRGIIHSVSYVNAKWIMENSKHREHLISHGIADDRFRTIDDALEEYLSRDPENRSNDKPSIIVSPALTTGYDFPHDKARHQVIVKVPFENPKSPLVKRLKEIHKGYLSESAGDTVVQIVGRINRASDDWGETLIPDECWRWVRKGPYIPFYFKRADLEVNRLPLPLGERL